MIVLDEQFLGRGIKHVIAQWYRGFVTIKEGDSWQHVPGDPGYCMMCFTLTNNRTREILQSLRVLFSLQSFTQKRNAWGRHSRNERRNSLLYVSDQADHDSCFGRRLTNSA